MKSVNSDSPKPVNWLSLYREQTSLPPDFKSGQISGYIPALKLFSQMVRLLGLNPSWFLHPHSVSQEMWRIWPDLLGTCLLGNNQLQEMHYTIMIKIHFCDLRLDCFKTNCELLDACQQTLPGFGQLLSVKPSESKQKWTAPKALVRKHHKTRSLFSIFLARAL